MKRYIYIAITLMAMLMVTSCEKDAIDNTTSGEGGFSLALAVNDNNVVNTRAATEEIKNSALVNIYKPNYTGLIRQYTYGSMPDVVYLPTGEGYRVDVVAGEAALSSPRKANFEQKSYKGSANFNVVANQITEGVSVEAKICNAITNVSFDQTILDNFGDSYALTLSLVKDATENTLVYDKSVITTANTSQEGYFIIDNAVTEKTIYWSFTGTKSSDNSTFTAKGEIAAPESNNNSLVGTRHNMKFKYIVKDGTLTFELAVDTQTETTTDNIVWAPTSTGLTTLKTSDIWATFVPINADVDAGTYNENKVYIQYREKPATETEWETPSTESADMVKAEFDTDANIFSTVLTGLNPETDYEYRLVVYTKDTTDAENNTIAGVVDVEILKNIQSFTTDKAQQVPNASFEEVKEGDYDIFNSEGVEPNATAGWWGTGNQKFGITIAITHSETNELPYTDNNNSKCVRMTSDEKAGKFAAGNIYSGYFAGLNTSTLQGTVHFGRTKAADGTTFTSRPTGVSFYVRYKGLTVDYAGGGLEKGAYDEGQVKVAIGTWGTTYGGSTESPISIYTGDSSNPPAHWNLLNLSETIAYGEKNFVGTGSDSGWMKVTLKLDYKNSNKFPTHIIISAAASRFGDYFAGAVGSTMYLDDIQLLYDHPDDITEGTVAVQ